jgi:predicted DNA-binding transcriptional regulator AlpA
MDYRLLTEPEAAGFTRLSRKTLQHLRYRGKGPAYCRLGRRIFYPQPELLAWIEQNLRRRQG